ncbi:protein of unknown function (plasmid) [Azospirillum baldaniorum]|uniref:Uncharacterized protein n=1 Tax=Azospirillum baldaniorum TaxID=1064539 RepID=A0A9P1JXT1_9PROT|nr:protein of unknown function [Azospirillum baldaniorum]
MPSKKTSIVTEYYSAIGCSVVVPEMCEEGLENELIT